MIPLDGKLPVKRNFVDRSYKLKDFTLPGRNVGVVLGSRSEGAPGGGGAGEPPPPPVCGLPPWCSQDAVRTGGGRSAGRAYSPKEVPGLTGENLFIALYFEKRWTLLYARTRSTVQAEVQRCVTTWSSGWPTGWTCTTARGAPGSPRSWPRSLRASAGSPLAPTPALKRRLAELDRLRVHVRPEHARAVEEHRLIAEVSGRGLFGRDHTGVLADLARILTEVAENRRRGRVSVPRVSRPYVPS